MAATVPMPLVLSRPGLYCFSSCVLFLLLCIVSPARVKGSCDRIVLVMTMILILPMTIAMTTFVAMTAVVMLSTVTVFVMETFTSANLNYPPHFLAKVGHGTKCFVALSALVFPTWSGFKGKRLDLVVGGCIAHLPVVMAIVVLLPGCYGDHV